MTDPVFTGQTSEFNGFTKAGKGALPVFGMELNGPPIEMARLLDRIIKQAGDVVTHQQGAHPVAFQLHRIDHGRAVLQQALELLMSAAQLLLGLAALAVQPSLVKHLVHCQPQPPQAVFEKVIPCPQLHHLHGHVFADGARNDDEGNAQAVLVEQLQRALAAKSWQPVIGQDDVDVRVQPVDIFLFCLHPMPLRLESGTAQLAQHQFGIIRIVFNDQNTQWLRHLTCPVWGLD